MKSYAVLSLAAAAVASGKIQRVNDCLGFYSMDPTKGNDWCVKECNDGNRDTEVFTSTCRTPEYTYGSGGVNVAPSEECYTTQVFGYSTGENPALVDMTGDWTKTETAAACQTRCQETEGCFWWHWNLEQETAVPAHGCVLKSREQVDKANEVDIYNMHLWDYKWCNSNMGEVCRNGFYDCSVCTGVQHCTWLSRRHIAGPKQCRFGDRPACYKPPPAEPTYAPTNAPTTGPTDAPNESNPTGVPTGKPTGKPTGEPTGEPSGEPSEQPTGEPSGEPSGEPTGQPTHQPTESPTGTSPTTSGTTGQGDEQMPPVVVPPGGVSTGVAIGAASGGVAGLAALGYAGYALKARLGAPNVKPSDLEVSADGQTPQAEVEQNVSINHSFYV